MKLSSLIFFLPVLAFFACESVSEPEISTTPLVVEGWIEDGANPVVTVAHALELKEGKIETDNYVEKWCRVSVYDGDTRYLLNGKIDHNYTTSFIFTTSRLRGKPGHTYRLLIETETDTAEAFSTIMPSASISSLKAEKTESPDGAYLLKLFLKNAAPAGLYKIFVRVDGKDKIYHGSFLGTFTGRDYDPEEGYTVSVAGNSTYNEDDFTHYFYPGEKVFVKVCTLDRPVYDFWKAYESAVSMSGNLFFTFAENCPANIEGGLGYWAAYGTSVSFITIPE